jgi:predicted metalloprotease with PDZ domain
MTVAYRLDLADRHAHAFGVTLTLPAPATEQVVQLPVWIPGSYLVREFARHLGPIEATQGGRPVPLRQRDKTTWVAHTSGRAALVLRYAVHAFDPSVRGAFLDGERGFFNGSSLFLAAEGRTHEPHRLQIGRLPAGWALATAMRPAGAGRRAFEAADYAELIDHPFELGRFWRGRFSAGGRPHELVVSGAWPGFDGERLLRDTQRLCAEEIRFWHGRGRPPFDRYLFLVHASEDGYGGLEHRASTALATARRDLPRRGTDADTETGDRGYLRLLGLISHEYFHAWHIKRLMPPELAAPDLSREAPTRLLWFFEGATSYYDDLMLRRAGCADLAQYLALLAAHVNGVAGTPGRRRQSVAQASFDAWTRAYRPDEHTPNGTVSYYAKGALVALCLDLTLRLEGRGTLDEVLRHLWRQRGAGPVDEAAIARALATVAGRSLQPELDAWVHGTGELPVAALLARFGVAAAPEPAPLAATLGLRLSEGPVSGVQVRTVLAGSAAECAGVSPGDELLAVDGWRIRRLEDARAWTASQQPIELLLARDQRVHRLRLRPPVRPAAASVQLRADSRADTTALGLRRAWLGA